MRRGVGGATPVREPPHEQSERHEEKPKKLWPGERHRRIKRYERKRIFLFQANASDWPRTCMSAPASSTAARPGAATHQNSSVAIR